MGVTHAVGSQYLDGNNGFVLQDRNEDNGPAGEQRYDGSLTGATSAQLQLDWG
jgi:hypothetical protein